MGWGGTRRAPPSPLLKLHPCRAPSRKGGTRGLCVPPPGTSQSSSKPIGAVGAPPCCPSVSGGTNPNIAPPHTHHGPPNSPPTPHHHPPPSPKSSLTRRVCPCCRHGCPYAPPQLCPPYPPPQHPGDRSCLSTQAHTNRQLRPDSTLIDIRESNITPSSRGFQRSCPRPAPQRTRRGENKSLGG